ncbi:flagellar hook-length control protein FliK [Paracoccus sp. S-4012]|uniref:flagellar hook-length control protein FliK n=1 Tax=Paracoccus sp. S-4012 TaxID=2665648 RepID=UPI001E4D0F44|nr:flagellar hook-length control protein FliK [Paracoccus sp. S-4012]
MEVEDPAGGAEDWPEVDARPLPIMPGAHSPDSGPDKGKPAIMVAAKVMAPAPGVEAGPPGGIERGLPVVAEAGSGKPLEGNPIAAAGGQVGAAAEMSSFPPRSGDFDNRAAGPTLPKESVEIDRPSYRPATVPRPDIIPAPEQGTSGARTGEGAGVTSLAAPLQRADMPGSPRNAASQQVARQADATASVKVETGVEAEKATGHGAVAPARNVGTAAAIVDLCRPPGADGTYQRTSEAVTARTGEAGVLELAEPPAEAATRSIGGEGAAATPLRPELPSAIPAPAGETMAIMAMRDQAERPEEGQRHQEAGAPEGDGPQASPVRTPVPAAPDAMRVRLRVDGETARLTVAPDELGPVEISVAADEAGLAIHVRADRAESGDLLRRHAELLQRELAEGGVAASRLTFSQSGQDGTPGGRSGHAGEPMRHPRARGTDAPQPAPAPAASGVTGRLDLRL